MDNAMNSIPSPAALLGRKGSHLAISLGIALAIAGALSLPKGIGSGLGSMMRGGSSSVAELVAVPAVEGKFVDRLSLAAGEDRLGQRPFTPATLAMPMVAAWPESEPRLVPAQATAAPIKLRTAAAYLAPLPPRRDPDLPDGRAAAITSPLLAAVDMPLPGEAQEDSGWSRIVTAPTEKVANVVAGTAGMAQAAGSWTWSQASGLLPRW